MLLPQPFAGFLRGRDIELRGEVGLLRTEEEVDDAERARAHDIVMLVRLLVEEGLLAEPPTELDEPTLRAAVHALLRRTPSWLVGISLDDLIGETEPVNLPGGAGDRFPSWTRRNARTLESLADDATVRRALGAERVWVPRPGSRDELRE